MCTISVHRPLLHRIRAGHLPGTAGTELKRTMTHGKACIAVLRSVLPNGMSSSRTRRAGSAALLTFASPTCVKSGVTLARVVTAQ